MSYARFSRGSDVYVFLSVDGYLECCGCSLQDDSEYPIIGSYFVRVGGAVRDRFTTTAAMLDHLDVHRAAGHAIQDETYENLRFDAAENDAWIAAVTLDA